MLFISLWHCDNTTNTKVLEITTTEDSILETSSHH